MCLGVRACVKKKWFFFLVVVIKKIAIIFVEHSAIAHDIFMSQFIPQTTEITFFSNCALVYDVYAQRIRFEIYLYVNKL